MKRWPIIRHIRALWAYHQVRAHYAMWLRMGYLPIKAHEDFAVIERIWRGEE